MTSDTSEKGLETLIVTAMTATGWIAGGSGDTELFRQFSDNKAFRKRLADSVFALTYYAQGAGSSEPVGRTPE